MKKQIIRELNFNKDCASGHICRYYGAFMDKSSGTISIIMEFCEGGSLDGIYKQVKKLGGRTGEKVLGKVADGVLNGLTYLHSRKIIHRGMLRFLATRKTETTLTSTLQISSHPTSSSAATAKSNCAISASAENSARKATPTPSSAHHTTWLPNESQASHTRSPPTSGPSA